MDNHTSAPTFETYDETGVLLSSRDRQDPREFDQDGKPVWEDRATRAAKANAFYAAQRQRAEAAAYGYAA